MTGIVPFQNNADTGKTSIGYDPGRGIVGSFCHENDV